VGGQVKCCRKFAFGRLAARRTGCWIRSRRLRRRRNRIQRGRLLGQRLLQLLDPLLEPRVAELFGAAAESIALQGRDHQPQPLDLGQRRAQDLLQRRRIFGQSCGGGEHPGTLNRRCESAPMNLA